MRLFRIVMVLFAALLVGGSPAYAQQDQRDATREKVRQVLETAGPRADVSVAFRQSTKQPYNFVGTMTTGLKNADSLEIVVSVTKSETIAFRVYPHYKNAYVNIGRARDTNGLMRKLLYLSDQNFLYWGADDSADIFCGYTVTLESGFPQDALVVILRSIRATDRFLGELRPFVDGSTSA
jgi:hypothetical protein